MSRTPMKERKIDIARDFDWITLILFYALVAVGAVLVYAVSYSPDQESIWDLPARFQIQLTWIGISVIVGGICLIIDSSFYRAFANPIYFFSLILLVLVLFIGIEVAGSKSWFDLGVGRFQPAELAKFATSLAIAAYLSSHDVSLKVPRHQFRISIILAIPVLLILLQGDFGTALVFVALMLPLFREGMPPLPYVVAIVGVLLFISALVVPLTVVFLILVLLGLLILLLHWHDLPYKMLFYAIIVATSGTAVYFGYALDAFYINAALVLVTGIILAVRKHWNILIYTGVALVLSAGLAFSVDYTFDNILKPHQQDRLNVWLQPHKTDPLGALYNLTQSKLAIGSGGFSGKGILQGTLTKYNYVPEQSTDFIFCTAGEEHGFIGSVAIVILFTLLLLRIIYLAERQRSRFVRVYAYSVAGIIFFHYFINIGMTMGLVPVVGIPLPFLSYGGSSLLSFTILIFVLLKLDSGRLLVFR